MLQPAHNPWTTAIREPVLERTGQSPRAGDGPDPFRYAMPGSLAADLERAGFADVHEEVLQVIWSFRGGPQEFWTFQSDLGGAWSRPGWETLSADEQAAVEAGVVRRLEPYRVGERLDVPVELNLATARR